MRERHGVMWQCQYCCAHEKPNKKEIKLGKYQNLGEWTQGLAAERA